MILSNEPGYYHDGSFGIRLENLVRVVAAKTPNNFRDRGFLTFETLTLCPIQVLMNCQRFSPTLPFVYYSVSTPTQTCILIRFVPNVAFHLKLIKMLSRQKSSR
jgi:hypothetical protein